MPESLRYLDPSPPYPLGAQWDGRGTQFAVFSQHAERIELCLFDASGRHETARYRFPDCTDGIWHGYLSAARPGQLYGYRAYGPYEPRHGHRFNHHKLLLDPYARQLAGSLRWHDALCGYRIGAAKGDQSFDRRDSAAYMPKAIIVDEHFDWGDDHPPRVPWADTVIYELHLRGFTQRRDRVPDHDRGTFGALGRADTIDYLRGLGVTAVELLPVHAFVRDRHLLESGLTNYWGYNTLSWFAPDPAYLSDGTLGQVKWAVQQLHRAGIEVILDVVYNHSCEGNELGPTLSLRGLDNASYYRLHPEDARHYINDTGCGNTLNMTHPRTIQLVMDSLRHWVSEFHIDGFRFDLSVTLGRETYGYDPGSGFFDALMQDPLLSRAKLIVEPWDLGPGGYQVGNHPAGTAEWNGRYRDDVRRYWRGDAGVRGPLAARLQGSADLFDHHRRRPWASVNFVTAHDGFTLEDLVSYDRKHNDANGEGNADGADDNYSHNWGHEGASTDAQLVELRDRIKRSLLATLLLSQGTPMLLAGDEFGQTQHGNNNAYCQDNEISWLDWARLDEARGRSLHDFVARLIAVRRSFAPLRVLRFLHGRTQPGPGLFDLEWFDEAGRPLSAQDWQNDAAHLLAVRRAVVTDGRVEVALLLFNGDTVTHRFRLPSPLLRAHVVFDTSDPTIVDRPLDDAEYRLPGKSIALLVATTTAAELAELAASTDARAEGDTDDGGDVSAEEASE